MIQVSNLSFSYTKQPFISDMSFLFLQVKSLDF